MLNRRELIHAGGAAAAASLLPPAGRAEAQPRPDRDAPFRLSKRNVVNVNAIAFILNDYGFIDHIRQGAGIMSPFGGGPPFATGVPWNTLLDADGWPNRIAASNGAFGGRFQVPDPKNFAGPYILDWDGNGVVNLNIVGEIGTLKATPTAHCRISAASSHSVALTSSGGPSKASASITLSGTKPGPQGIFVFVSSTGAAGAFVRNVRFYRAEDAADLAKGLIFRRAWKQPLVGLCPSAIRFMNWLGGNNDRNCRFENRTPPNNAGWTGQSNWTASPAYGESSGTNQYKVAAATPTTGNPRTTPASMLHGELATLRFANGFARTTSNLAVTSITNAANGVVTTATAHGYRTGDVIGHFMPLIQNIAGTFNGTTTVTNVSNTGQVIPGMFVYGAGIQVGTTVIAVASKTLTLSLPATISGSGGLGFRSMKNLHLFPCIITVTGPTTYQLNVDTTDFGPFSANAALHSYQFITLQVGSGNDRTAYPCMFADAGAPASLFGQYLRSTEYKTWYFDKTVSGQTDGSGNYLPGVWMFSATPQQSGIGHSGDTPIEVCVALVNELNAMSPAHTIGMWMNIPAWGLSSMDPDYAPASDWAVNAVDVVMNPASKVRAAGFSALGYSGATQLDQPVLIIEYSNELWPSGTNDGRGYLISRGIQRWPSITPQQNWQDMKALRSTCFVRDIKASNPPGLSRIRFVLGMWGSIGIGHGDFAGNYATVFGGVARAVPTTIGDWYTNDKLVTNGSWGRPIDNHDGVCLATYFDPPGSYCKTVRGKGTLSDDSAMFDGSDNSANGGGNYTGHADPSQAISNFVAGVVDAAGRYGEETITRYATKVIPQFAAAMPSGKIVLGYEGGTDWQTSVGGNQNGHVLTAGDALFTAAVINSPQWAAAQVGFFDAVSKIPNCFMPSIYLWIGQRWGYCWPDSYATISGKPTEGAALTVNSPVWIAMGKRNRALAS